MIDRLSDCPSNFPTVITAGTKNHRRDPRGDHRGDHGEWGRCLIKCKQQKQKRFLLHPVSELHKRFCASHPDVKISQSTFALLKPFWVKKPRIQDRDTCLCKLHENARLLHEKLRQMKLIPNCSVANVVRHTVCNRELTNRSCTTNTCTRCKNRNFPFSTTLSLANHAISWHQWQTVCVDADARKQVRKTAKQTVRGSVNSLKASYVSAVN